MTLFHDRSEFERQCRRAGIIDLAFDHEADAYTNPHTQKTFLVWDSLAQTRLVRRGPVAWLTRRRGKDQGISVPRPYQRKTREEWEALEAIGWEQPVALWPSPPAVSPSAEAFLRERQRQVNVEGFDPVRDQRFRDHQLLRAAGAYIIDLLMPDYAKNLWPWPSEPMRKASRLRTLEKAGALLIAEHERITATEPQEAPE